MLLSRLTPVSGGFFPSFHPFLVEGTTGKQGGFLMIRKALCAAALLALASVAYAATDYPSGYTKCAKEGETCSFSGTRSVAYGKAGTFVYATLTGPISCAASRFPSINVGTPRYCSYGPAGSSSSSSSGGSCPTTTIVPFINGTQTASATISSGAQTNFAPTPSSGGSWSWSGCGTSGTSRTQTVNPTASCSATATYTNTCGTQSTQSFSITVNTGGGSSSGGGSPGTPVGFGRATTGGAGGTVVTARTGAEINAALCARASVSTPIIIRVDGTINHGNTTRATGACDTTATEIQFKGVSNVSLIGVSNRGVLDQIGIHLRGTSNIIIQNLHIRNVKKSGSPTSNGGDSIGMESTVNNVWVDHNTLEASGGESDGYDSLLDMKSGVTNVTVSFNHYRNSSRAGLIGSSDSDSANTNITFHHNWYENIEQRTPLLRHGLAHSYNNYFSNISNSEMIHGINSRMGGRILVEGNYFKNSNNPLIASDDSPQAGCWQTRSNTLDSITYDRAVGDGALVIPIISGGQFDSTCTVSVPYSYTLDPSANIPTSVMGSAGVGKTGQ
jgi:pectate lyase